MANISVTALCNRNCGYCFATGVRDRLMSDPHMSLCQYDAALDFLERSGIDQARLLGGEPTLHPQFPEIVARAVERGLQILVFSNGEMPESALIALKEQPADSVSVLLNVTSLAESNSEQQKIQLHTMRQLGSRVTLGVNIDRPGLDLGSLLDKIETYGLKREVRLGLAHPSIGRHNRYLHPNRYREAGDTIADFLALAAGRGVRVGFDCGFVPCMFPDGVLEHFPSAADSIGNRCNPILDVLPNGQVVSCYPLANMASEALPADRDAGWLRERFAQRMAPYRALGARRECNVCDHRKRGGCSGGCLATAVRRLRQTPFRVALPRHFAVTVSLPEKRMAQPEGDGSGQWVVPYVDQPVEFWQQIASDFAGHIKEVYFPLPGGVIGSGRPPQPAEHLHAFLHTAPLPCSVLINPVTLPAPVEDIAPAVISQLRRLMDDVPLAGATVANFQLATAIHEDLPELPLTASVLMDIACPNQALIIEGVCGTLVPASRIMRNLPALRALGHAFVGRIRLIVNEACLPGCPYRTQHFHEMANGRRHPRSLCHQLLERNPWMRLTGAWVLPQHLHLFDGVHDELKLAGRATLQNPERYRRVLEAYVHRNPLMPHEIGGGPASPLRPIDISEEFYRQTLECELRCDECSLCRQYGRSASVPGSDRQQGGNLVMQITNM